jgi:hypothetical protein
VITASQNKKIPCDKSKLKIKARKMSERLNSLILKFLPILNLTQTMKVRKRVEDRRVKLKTNGEQTRKSRKQVSRNTKLMTFLKSSNILKKK